MARLAAIGAAALGLGLALSGPVAPAQGRASPAPDAVRPARTSVREAPVGQLGTAIAAARPGDTIWVRRGRHQGNFVLGVPEVTLAGEPGAVLDGTGRGTVLAVKGRSCRISRLALEGSGLDVLSGDAALRIQGSDGVVVEDVTVARSLNGIYVLGSRGVRLDRCTLRGLFRTSTVESGDGIHLFKADDGTVSECEIEGFRDGCYIEFSPGTYIRGVRAGMGSRYGLHVMFDDRIRVESCRFEHNTVGSILMNSRRIAVRDCVFAHQRGPIGQGLAFKENDDSVIEGNRIADNTVGLFMDGANGNRIRGNRIVANGWGVLLQASSQRNAFSGNAFIANDFEVAIDMPTPTNRFEGNYWSGYRGLPIRGGPQVPHVPVKPFGFLVMQQPDLMAFAGSPAARALDAAFQTLPGLAARQVSDPSPLFSPPPDPAVAR